MLWLAALFLIALITACGAVLVRSHRHRQIEREAIRRRFVLEDSQLRLPLVDHSDASRGQRLIDTLRQEDRGQLVSQVDSSESHTRTIDSESTQFAPASRIVTTINGPTLLTTPPFVLKAAVLSPSLVHYVNALRLRLPPWILICPKVRLDSIVNPTNPAGRDADDWRRWRRRVRFRAVDFLLCDRRDFKPILAILIENPMRMKDLRTIAGGRDRLVDEVLATAGLPFIRASGELHNDWLLIEPYIGEAVLPTRDPCVEGDSHQRRDPISSAAAAFPDHNPQRLSHQAAARLINLDD